MHNQNNIALQIGVSQKVVHRLRAAEWEQLALEHGYFDQSRLFSSFEASERWTDERRSPMKHRYYRLASGAFLVNGRYDVILHVSVKDVDHLRNVGARPH